jgi:hypothetical protein
MRARVAAASAEAFALASASFALPSLTAFSAAFSASFARLLSMRARPAVEELLLGLEHDHLTAALRRHLHDAVAHQAAADHADFLDRHELCFRFSFARTPPRARGRR